MPKRANIEKYFEVIENGNVLHENYKAYENQYVHRAHEELYKLLADILDYVRNTLKNNDTEGVIRAIRSQLKNEYSIKTTTKTDGIGVILRLVLRGAHRKTLHTYSRVIKQAINNDVDADSLSDYIKANGGIERLRAGAAEIQAKSKHETDQRFCKTHMSRLAADLLNATANAALATFEIDEALQARMHDTANRCEFRYMVCTYNGKYNVVDMVPMDKDLEAEILFRIASRKADLEYFMSDDELRTYERVKQEYAASAGLKAKPSKYAARLATTGGLCTEQKDEMAV